MAPPELPGPPLAQQLPAGKKVRHITGLREAADWLPWFLAGGGPLPRKIKAGGKPVLAEGRGPYSVVIELDPRRVTGRLLHAGSEVYGLNHIGPDAVTAFVAPNRLVLRRYRAKPGMEAAFDFENVRKVKHGYRVQRRVRPPERAIRERSRPTNASRTYQPDVLFSRDKRRELTTELPEEEYPARLRPHDEQWEITDPATGIPFAEAQPTAEQARSAALAEIQSYERKRGYGLGHYDNYDIIDAGGHPIKVLDFLGENTDEDLALLERNGFIRKVVPVLNEIIPRFIQQVVPDYDPAKHGHGIGTSLAAPGIEAYGVWVPRDSHRYMAEEADIFIHLWQKQYKNFGIYSKPIAWATQIVDQILHEVAHYEVRDDNELHKQAIDRLRTTLGQECGRAILSLAEAARGETRMVLSEEFIAAMKWFDPVERKRRQEGANINDSY